MARRHGDQLDRAHDELRAWCHARPDLQDPSLVYGALGSINAILATLEHILDLVGRTASRASRADDERSVAEATAAVTECGRSAVGALEQAYREVAVAHAIVSHLAFPVADDISE
ncbi:MAG: hypothetical protein WAS51_01930 [Ilumatobacteraceae bacterium]